MSAPTELVCFEALSAVDAGAPHLCELASVRVTHGEIEDHFHAHVRPEVPVEEGVSARTALDDEALRDAEPAKAVLERWLEWAGSAWLVSHGPCPAETLGFAFSRAGLQPPGVRPPLDAAALAREAFPDAPAADLPSLAEQLELDLDDHERALPRAVACWLALEASLERLGAPAAALLRHPAPPLLAPAPHLPRRLRALAVGREVVLVYGEGPREPARLPVLPRFVYSRRGTDYLEAECRISDTLKTYRLDRIAAVEDPRRERRGWRRLGV